LNGAQILGGERGEESSFLRVLPWKRKGERSELSVLFFLVFAQGGEERKEGGAG